MATPFPAAGGLPITQSRNYSLANYQSFTTTNYLAALFPPGLFNGSRKGNGTAAAAEPR